MLIEHIYTVSTSPGQVLFISDHIGNIINFHQLPQQPQNEAGQWVCL